ncbi:hypothetical protein ACF0H5_007548 [Mactra antiquata]
MAPSTTMVNAGIHDPGSVHGNMSTLTPLSQGQHGNTDTGSSPNIGVIVGGVLGPLIVIGVVAFLIYVWYRRKYPVRMVLGRDFAKFSNPAYNTRQSTLTLVREDSDKAWDTLTNPNLARGAVIDEEVEGYHNVAFEKDTETKVPDENIDVETEDVTNSEQAPTTVEEKEVTRKISRERPKTKRAVLVKTPDVDEFDNAFELVTESDLGQRRESEISSGNDSIDTRTVSISLSETFDNRHGSLVSYPGDTIPPQQIQEEVNVQSSDDSDLMENNSEQDKSSNEEDVNESETSDNKDKFESFVEDFNNESLNKQGLDSIEQTNSEGGEDSSNRSAEHIAKQVAEENVLDNVTSNGNEDPQNTTNEAIGSNEIGDMPINHFNEEKNKQSEHSENSSTVVTDTEMFENITVSSYEMQTTSVEPVVDDISYAQIITEESETIPSNEKVEEIGIDNADMMEHLAVENGYVFCEENVDQEIHIENYSEENVDTTKKEEDNSICLSDGNSMRSLSLSVDSIDRLSSTGSLTSDSSKKPQALSLSSERIYLENVPPTPTVLVQDSIIFESEAMHQIHLETPDVEPLRGRRAFTLNDIHIDKKINNEDSKLSDSSSVKNADARSTSSPEIRDMKYKGFNPSKRFSFDFSLIGDSSRSLDQPEGAQEVSVDDTTGDNKHTFIDTILDNALLDSTVIKTNVRANESESIQASDRESEINKEPADETNMFTSISSDISEQFESSSHFEEEKNVALLVSEINEQSHQVKEYEFQFVPTTDNKLKYETVNEHMSIEQNSDTSTSANKGVGNLVDVNTIQAEMSTDEFIMQQSSIIKDDTALQLELDRTEIIHHSTTPFKHQTLEKFDEDYFSGNKTTDNVDKPIDDGFITALSHDPISTTQNSDDISAEINNPASKKKVVAASFDFNTFGNDSDSESSSSVSTSNDSDDEISKSSDTSRNENSSSEDGETEGIYKFETISKHSTKTHSIKPEILKHENDPDKSESIDSTTLSWELLSRENSVDVNKLELCDKIDEESTDSISGDEAIGSHIEMIKPDSNVTNKLLESSDTSWDVVGGIDDNSEC